MAFSRRFLWILAVGHADRQWSCWHWDGGGIGRSARQRRNPRTRIEHWRRASPADRCCVTHLAMRSRTALNGWSNSSLACSLIAHQIIGTRHSKLVNVWRRYQRDVSRKVLPVAWVLIKERRYSIGRYMRRGSSSSYSRTRVFFLKQCTSSRIYEPCPVWNTSSSGSVFLDWDSHTLRWETGLVSPRVRSTRINGWGVSVSREIS